jgi:RimJ/RimL family protein N-acetyltransferase
LTDGPIDLLGARTRLTRFTAADITKDYIGWLNDPLVTRFSNQRFATHDLASSKTYLASFDGSPNLFLSIRRRDDARAIGTMTAYISTHHRTADMGILIGDRDSWGGGFGQDAWDSLLAWLLGERGLRKVTAGTLAVNQPMVRIAERAGMLLEGRRARQEVVDGKAIDILYYARFADD